MNFAGWLQGKQAPWDVVPPGYDLVPFLPAREGDEASQASTRQGSKRRQWDEASQASTRRRQWDEASQASTRRGRWDEASQASTRRGRWDEASQASTRRGQQDDASQASTRRRQWDEASQASTRRGRWDEASQGGGEELPDLVPRGKVVLLPRPFSRRSGDLPGAIEEDDEEAETLRLTPDAVKMLRNAIKRRPGKLAPLYDAVEAKGDFGLIREPGGAFLAHARGVKGRDRILSIRQGDRITVMRTSGGKVGSLGVQFVTRSKYFSPGKPVTSVVLGIDDAEWDDLVLT